MDLQFLPANLRPSLERRRRKSFKNRKMEVGCEELLKVNTPSTLRNFVSILLAPVHQIGRASPCGVCFPHIHQAIQGFALCGKVRI